MATYGSGLRVSAAVAASGTTGTIYTCSSGSYAILNLYVPPSTGSAATVTVGGRNVYSGVTGAAMQIYVGPSQSVAVTSPSVTCEVSGVEFVNGS